MRKHERKNYRYRGSINLDNTGNFYCGKSAIAGVVSSSLIGMLLLSACSSIPDKQDRLLADSFTRQLYDMGKGTPWEYAGNRIGSRDTYISKRILTRQFIPATPDVYVSSQDNMLRLKEDIQRGKNWPFKQSIQVELPFLNSDKDLWPDWTKALEFKGEYPIGEVGIIQPDTSWMVGWDYNYLFVKAEFHDHNIVSVSDNPERNTSIWHGDALEIFVRSEPRLRCYWEIVINPNGEVYDGIQQNNRWGGFIGNPDDSMNYLEKRIEIFEYGYSIELAIPWKELPGYMKGNRPNKGDRITFMLIRCDNGKQSSCVPLLYGGHNIFGYINAILK